MMTVRSQIEALLRAASPRKGHRDGAKYLYYSAGTVAHPHTGSKIKGKSDVHRVLRRVINPKRDSK